MFRPTWIAQPLLASVIVSMCAACVVAAPAPPPQTSGTPSTSPPVAEAQIEMSALLVDLIAPQLCDRLVGSYIGLPGDSAAQGAAAGAEASVGRWWIRRCEARAQDGRLHLAMNGMGWTFVDRESSGFRVRQYLRFDADAQLNATMEVGYDSRKKIASLWMRPGDSVVASVVPRGLVSATATGVFSAIAGSLLTITGDSADDHARAQAQEQGSTQLRERLSAGFTLTFDVERKQLDFMVGALERGQTPERPYPNSGETAWQVNQRSRVWPGGLDVVGPIDHAHGAQQLDIEIEDGDQAIVRAVCASELERYLDTTFQGGRALPPTGRDLAALARVGTSARVMIEPDACPLVLLLSTAATGDVPVRLRYRVADPTPVAANVATTAGDPPITTTVQPAAPRQVRLQIASVSVHAHNSSGNAWDVLGGEADLFVRMTSLGEGREIDRTPTRDNSNEATFDYWLPGAFRAETFPLRIAIYDKDVTTDELIGSVDVPASAVLGRNRELILEVHSQDTTPVRVGTLRIRIEALP